MVLTDIEKIKPTDNNLRQTETAPQHRKGYGRSSSGTPGCGAYPPRECGSHNRSVLNDSFLWQHYRVNLEDGEKAVFMRGTFVNDDPDAATADHLLLEQGYVTIVPFNAQMTDLAEMERLQNTL